MESLTNDEIEAYDEESVATLARDVAEGVPQYTEEILSVIQLLVQKVNTGRTIIRKESSVGFASFSGISDLQEVRSWLQENYSKKFDTFEENIRPRQPKKSFESLFIPTKCSFAKRTAGCPIEDFWKEAGTNTRIIIEGELGSGKSTLCRSFARNQSWEDRFGCVILVDVPALQSLSSFCLKDVLKALGIPSQFLKVIQNYQDFVLWVWEDFDREEVPARDDAFQEFLSGLVEGTLKWAQHSIIAARNERRRILFKNASVASPVPWYGFSPVILFLKNSKFDKKIKLFLWKIFDLTFFPGFSH
jgi:hypothetical protein